MKRKPQRTPSGLAIPVATLLLSIFLCHVDAGGGTVTTDNECYEYDQDIKITFRIEDPGEDDWVGVYPARGIDGDLDPVMWLWSCGTQGCWGKTNQGQLTFGGRGVNVDYLDEWPLDPGPYRAVLGRNGEDDGPYYEIFAQSDVFEVQSTTGYCGTLPPSPAPTAAPSPGPTKQPTRSPTDAPTKQPTSSPTGSPTHQRTNPPIGTPAPTPEPKSTNTSLKNMAPVIAAAKTDIARLVLKDPALGALFLKMIFHDCLGGCDGCINLSNPINGFLELAMDILEPIANTYEPQGLSRPDIWVLASFIGVEMSMPGDDFLAIPFQTIGRQSCDAGMRHGPNPEVCSPNLDTDDILSFFRAHFDFTPRETAAMMGAHTIGVMHRDNLGFDGQNGWTFDNNSFNNGYYLELVGPGTDQQSQVNRAPNWQQKFIDNSHLGDVPSVYQWEGYPNGKKIVMLNSDIALVRQLHSGNKDADGKVGCQFVTRGGSGSPCPMARADLFTEMVRYRNDNQAFLEDFRDALIKMTHRGYSVDSNSCDSGGICRLTKA